MQSFYPDETHYEDRSITVSMYPIRLLGSSNSSWTMGEVKVSHFLEINPIKNSAVEFYRVQYREVGRFLGGKWFPSESDECRFNSVRDSIQITVDVSRGVAKLGPKGNIVMRSQGKGLGRYLLATVTAWAKERYPNCEVAKGDLSPVDARREDNKDRRDAFYRNAGFNIQYDSPDEESGYFWSEKIDQLSSEWNREKVEVLTAERLATLFDDANNAYRAADTELKLTKGRVEDCNQKVLALTSWRKWLFAGALTMILFPALPAWIHSSLIHLVASRF